MNIYEVTEQEIIEMSRNRPYRVIENKTCLIYKSNVKRRKNKRDV